MLKAMRRRDARGTLSTPIGVIEVIPEGVLEVIPSSHAGLVDAQAPGRPDLNAQLDIPGLRLQVGLSAYKQTNKQPISTRKPSNGDAVVLTTATTDTTPMNRRVVRMCMPVTARAHACVCAHMPVWGTITRRPLLRCDRFTMIASPTGCATASDHGLPRPNIRPRATTNVPP